MSEKKRNPDITRHENALLFALIVLTKQQDIIDKLISHAKAPSLFQENWDDLVAASDSAKLDLVKAIKELLPEIENVPEQ